MDVDGIDHQPRSAIPPTSADQPTRGSDVARGSRPGIGVPSARVVLPLYDDNPTGRVPYLTILFIALNVVVFAFVQPRGGEAEVEFTYRYAVIPCELDQGSPLSQGEAFTGECGLGREDEPGSTIESVEVAPGKNVWLAVIWSMFLHGSWLHLLGNVWFLWVFGNNIEERFGRAGFVAFYLASGIVATLAHVLVDTGSTIPLIGASGAVAGVMGAYIVLFPRARVLTWWPMFLILVVYIPAVIVLGLWFLMQFATDPNSGVAWQAHVGGFLFGAAVAWALRSRLRPLPVVTRHRRVPRGTFGARRPDPTHTWDPPYGATPWSPPIPSDTPTWAPPGGPPAGDRRPLDPPRDEDPT
jgi:membrane associated rhomboid family serine protease